MAEINFGSLIRSLIFSPYVAVLYGSENKRLHEFIYTSSNYTVLMPKKKRCNADSRQQSAMLGII
jgi:hypothetical protein